MVLEECESDRDEDNRLPESWAEIEMVRAPKTVSDTCEGALTLLWKLCLHLTKRKLLKGKCQI